MDAAEGAACGTRSPETRSQRPAGSSGSDSLAAPFLAPSFRALLPSDRALHVCARVTPLIPCDALSLLNVSQVDFKKGNNKKCLTPTFRNAPRVAGSPEPGAPAKAGHPAATDADSCRRSVRCPHSLRDRQGPSVDTDKGTWFQRE